MNQSQIDNYNASESGKAWRNRKLSVGSEAPSFNRQLLTFAAEGKSPWTTIIRDIFDGIEHETKGTPLAMGRGISELFGHRLAALAGVSVPNIELMEAPDGFTPDLPNQKEVRACDSIDPNYRWIITPYSVYKNVGGGMVVSNRVYQGLPIYFLRDRVETCPHWLKIIENIEWAVDKACPLAREDYADFPVTSETDQRVLDACHWASDQRLLTYAYRAFLNCCLPHASNTLVDVGGRIHIIDHEKILFRSDCKDIAELAGLVGHSEHIVNICRQISRIDSRHMKEALQGIPEAFWQSEGILDNERDAVDYFSSRVAEWRRHFGGQRPAL